MAGRQILGRAEAALDRKAVDNLVTGPSIEKSIAPLRSFVASRCGSAGCFWPATPPTSCRDRGQRFESAASDVHYLSQALREFYDEKCSAGIDAYRRTALARMWKAERFCGG